jgi:hypothetical protein
MYHFYISKAMSGEGGMVFLDSTVAKLVCSDLSSELNLTGWYSIPVDHISFWDKNRQETVQIYYDSICTSLG